MGSSTHNSLLPVFIYLSRSIFKGSKNSKKENPLIYSIQVCGVRPHERTRIFLKKYAKEKIFL